MVWQVTFATEAMRELKFFLEGDAQSVKSFMHDLTRKSRLLAQIDTVKSTELSGKNQYDKFTIFKSSEEAELQVQSFHQT